MKKRFAIYLKYLYSVIKVWLVTACDDNRHALPISHEMRRRNCVHCFFVLGLLMIFALAVLGRFLRLQYSEHDKHLRQADRILGIKQRLIGTRGEIFDRDNNLLAGNIRTRDLYATPRLVVDAKDPDLDGFCKFLSENTGIPKKELRAKFEEVLVRDVPVLVSEIVQIDKALELERMHLPGVSVVPCRVAGYKGYRSIYISPRMIPEIENLRGIVGVLEASLNLDGNTLATRINKAMKKRFAVQVQKNISIENANALNERFISWAAKRNKSGKIIGYRVPTDAIHFEATTTRYYPKGRMLANVLGFCDADEHGLSGIEALMDKELRRTVSSRYLASDGNIQAKNLSSTLYQDELNGYAVHLTIQYPIQQIVEKVMEDVVEENHPERAYALMLDPHTGAIMALSQYPNFDFNDKNTITAQNREFHALLCAYEPGSIMKAVSVSSAMDHANLKPNYIVDCENGNWIFANRALHEHGNARFGDISIKQIIQKSSNIGSAKVVIENMSNQIFYNYLRSYGFGQKSHVGFYPAEGSAKYFTQETNGILRSVEKWYKIDVSRIAIGHSISISPFQMVQAYGAICNGGRMMQPYIVDRIVSPDGKVIPSVPHCKGQPISSTTAERILDCLSATVERGGTATSAVVDGYNVAGKTGTAMKLARCPDGKMRYSRSLNTASFIGLVPLENPAFVLLITVDEPKGRAQYGGSVCGKPFSRIATETLRILQIPPSKEESVADAK